MTESTETLTGTEGFDQEQFFAKASALETRIHSAEDTELPALLEDLKNFLDLTTSHLLKRMEAGQTKGGGLMILLEATLERLEVLTLEGSEEHYCVSHNLRAVRQGLVGFFGNHCAIWTQKIAAGDPRSAELPELIATFSAWHAETLTKLGRLDEAAVARQLSLDYTGDPSP